MPGTRPRSAVGEGLAIGALFLVLTLLWLAPLLPVFRTAQLSPLADATSLGRADALLTSWMLSWSSHALRTNPLDLFEANIFHPLRHTLAFSEHMAANAVLAMPVDLVWNDPVLDHNVVLVLSFTLLGTGTALLVRELGGSVPSSVLAGLFVTFNPGRFGTLGHLHGLSTHWMPFAFLALHRCFRTGHGAVLVAGATLLVALSSVYHAYFYFVAAGVFLVAHWALRCASAPGGRVRAVAGVGAAAAVTAVTMLGYLVARDLYGLGRDDSQALWFGARGVTYLGALADPVGYLRARYVLDRNPMPLLGLGMLPLFALGMVGRVGPGTASRRVRGVYLLVAVAMALVSMGPVLQWTPSLTAGGFPGPWVALAALVPGFDALRVPVRAGAVVVLAVGVVAGLGADVLWRRMHGRGRVALAVVFMCVGLAEAWHPTFGIMGVPWARTGVPPVYDWLARQPGSGAVVELPLGDPLADVTYMVHSSRHWRPLVNGYSGFAPTTPFFTRLLASFPATGTVRLLHDLGVRWVVVHRGADRRGLCAGARSAGVALPVAYEDRRSCVLALEDVPPPERRSADREVPRRLLTLTASDGSSTSAALDGDLATHWTHPTGDDESWLRIDMAGTTPRRVSRVVVDLGPHYGEYLHRWRLEGSIDGRVWRTLAAADNGIPPLADMRVHPSRLTTELRAAVAAEVRSLRIVSALPGSGKANLQAESATWGVHGVRIYESFAAVVEP